MGIKIKFKTDIGNICMGIIFLMIGIYTLQVKEAIFFMMGMGFIGLGFGIATGLEVSFKIKKHSPKA